jgi:hypothetical protein
MNNLYYCNGSVAMKPCEQDRSSFQLEAESETSDRQSDSQS